MNKFGTRLLAALVASSLIVMPVSAEPSVDKLKEDKKAAQSEMNALKKQLSDTIEKINEIENDLVEKGQEIAEVSKDVEKTSEKEREQYNDMKLRIKYMYEEGNSTALEVIFSCKDFSELINKAEYVQNVHTYDRNKLEEYVATKKKLDNLKTKLEKEQKEIIGMQAEFEEKEADLDRMVAEKGEEIANFDGMIEEAIAEAARRAEEERLRKEAEEKAKAEAEAQRQQAAAGNAANNNTQNENNNQNTNNDAVDTDNKEETSKPGGSGSFSGSTTVSRAYSKLGSPYVWGATGPNTFDCSGFVGYCLTGSTSRWCTSSSFAGYPAVSDPQPGDVCYKPGHVGIYIGGGQMIHAPRTGDVVKVSSVHSGMKIVRP